MPAVTVHRRTSADGDYRALIAQLDRHLAELNGDSDSFYAPLNLSDALVGVVVATVNGEAVGCGAFRTMPDGGAEIKRMFVAPENRGLGLGGAILAELEDWALSTGHSVARLETSERLSSAVRLYERCGYRRIPNYEPYVGAGDSVCFQKDFSAISPS